jgi:peroxiredoxin
MAYTGCPDLKKRFFGEYGVMRRKNLYLMTILSCVASLALQAADVPVLPIGSAAPDFSLPGVDGKTYALKDFSSAKVLLIAFISNHCPEAQAYEDRLIKLTNDYKDKGVTVVAINPNSPKGVRLDELGYTDLDDTFESMKIRAAYKKFNFVYLDDGETQKVSLTYGPRVTPHYFVFDAERKLRYEGRMDDNNREEYVKVHDLQNALDAVLSGKEVAVKSTKTAGCSTKWADKQPSVVAWNEKVAAEPVTVELIDADGLKTLRKGDPEKLRLVNFWDTGCGPCIAEMPELVTINRSFRHRAFEFITVSTNKPDEKADALTILKKKQVSTKNYVFGDVDGYKLRAAFDPEWDASNPYTMLIGTKGEVLYKANGRIDGVELKRAIVKALKELNHGLVMDPPKKK